MVSWSVAIDVNSKKQTTFLVSIPAGSNSKKREQEEEEEVVYGTRRNTRERRLNTSDVRDFKIPFVLL